MRILKSKIALSAQHKAQVIQSEPDTEIKDTVPIFAQEVCKDSPMSNISQHKTREGKKTTQDAKSTKTVVKNYGKAIASFAATPIALPYLLPLINQEGVDHKEFVDYICTAKESIEGIDTFRALLLVKNTDEDKMAAFKRVFKGIAEIFIKYFSVNWIFSGRMVNKEVHLRSRFKMLRRIKNPELFTYLK